MSKVAIKGADTGTGIFTLESPATNTDRTLVLPDEAGTVLTSASGVAKTGDTMTGTLNVQTGNLNVGSQSGYGGVLSVNRLQTSGIAALATFRDASAGTTLDIETYGDPAYGTVNRIKYSGPYLAIRNGSQDNLRIDSAGRVTMPYQPFVVLGAPGVARTSGTYRHWGGAGYVMSNVGGHWNSSTQQFTSPVDGKYFVHVQLRMSSETNTTYNYINLVNSNSSANGSPLRLWSPANDSGTYRPHSVSWIMHLRAGDTFAPELILNAAATLDGGYTGQTDDGVVIMLIG